MAVTKVTGGVENGGIRINDLQIVTERQAAITNATAVANSNNVGDLPTKVNAVLAALRAHGLIY